MGATPLGCERMAGDWLGEAGKVAGAARLECIPRTPLYMNDNRDPLARIDVAYQRRALGRDAIASCQWNLRLLKGPLEVTHFPLQPLG